MKLLYFLTILVTVFLTSRNHQALASENQLILVDDNPVEEETDDAEQVSTSNSGRKNSFDIKFDETGTGLDTFVPTNEWQLIKPGQAIPKGIHVRLNMQTGEREGKLLDEAIRNEPTKERRVISKELENAIKDLNDAPESIEDQIVRSKFKSADEIKSEMDELNMNMKTDFEIIRELITRFNRTDIQKEEKLVILKDLEFYVHQYDNGLLLNDLGGFNAILTDLNKTDDLQTNIEGILVLGSAIQSNPKAKVFAIETDLLQYILNKLSLQSASDSTLVLEFNLKLVFTLSGLLRNFPYAQSKFIRYGGVEILSNMIKHSSSIKLKTKILTLVDDLIKEKRELLANAASQQQQETIKQYKDVNLIEELMAKDWCAHYDGLLNNAEGHDTREKIINSIITLVGECRESFGSNRSMINNLKKLKKEYTELAKDDSDNYFNDLISSIDYVLTNIDPVNNKPK